MPSLLVFLGLGVAIAFVYVYRGATEPRFRPWTWSMVFIFLGGFCLLFGLLQNQQDPLDPYDKTGRLGLVGSAILLIPHEHAPLAMALGAGLLLVGFALAGLEAFVLARRRRERAERWQDGRLEHGPASKLSVKRWALSTVLMAVGVSLLVGGCIRANWEFFEAILLRGRWRVPDLRDVLLAVVLLIPEERAELIAGIGAVMFAAGLAVAGVESVLYVRRQKLLHAQRLRELRRRKRKRFA